MAGEKLLDPDLRILVFSAHKTGTQTLKATFNAGGVRAIHAHTSPNLDITDAELPALLRRRRAETGQPLDIVSVFREPMERMVSSFFQALSRHPWAATRTPEEIAASGPPPADPFAMEPEALHRLFCDYLERVDGFGESLDVFCGAMALPVTALRFCPQAQYGCYETPLFRLHLYRFDSLMADFGLLARIPGLGPLSVVAANRTRDKPYASVQAAFGATVRVPDGMLYDLYRRRRPLLDLFHPGAAEALFDRALARHGGGVDRRSPDRTGGSSPPKSR